MALSLPVIFFLAVAAWAQTSDFAPCTALFKENRYAESVDCLNQALYQTPDRDTLARVGLYQGLGVNYMMLDKTPLAAAAFGRLVRLKPGHELDPNAFLPEIVALYQSVKLDEKSRMAPVVPRPFYHNLIRVLPLGAPQIHKRETGKGLAVLAVQTGALLTAGLAAGNQRSLHSDRFGYAEEDLGDARMYGRVNLVALFVFTGAYVYSVCDAFLKPAPSEAAWPR